MWTQCNPNAVLLKESGSKSPSQVKRIKIRRPILHLFQNSLKAFVFRTFHQELQLSLIDTHR